MKKYLFTILLCAISIITVPIAVTGKEVVASKKTAAEKNITEKSTQNAKKTTEKNTEEASPKGETISVFLSAESKTVSMDLFEYVCGSVAAEMPLAYEEEAIKAQAVACYTNALRLKKTKEAENGDISDDTAVHQGYINKAQRKEKWGDDFSVYEEKLQSAVKDIFGKAIYYENELCVASFCAISNGKTEDAQNLWNYKIPYLKSVDSAGDKESAKYATTVTYTQKEFLALCKKAGLTATATTDLKITEKSETGMVLKCKIGKKELSGQNIREIFGLRSPTFTVKTDKNSITFTVKGYGHGVGLSQNGANYLAQQGYTYEEILKHYYTDVTIK